MTFPDDCSSTTSSDEELKYKQPEIGSKTVQNYTEHSQALGTGSQSLYKGCNTAHVSIHASESQLEMSQVNET